MNESELSFTLPVCKLIETVLIKKEIMTHLLLTKEDSESLQSVFILSKIGRMNGLLCFKEMPRVISGKLDSAR